MLFGFHRTSDPGARSTFSRRRVRLPRLPHPPLDGRRNLSSIRRSGSGPPLRHPMRMRRRRRGLRPFLPREAGSTPAVHTTSFFAPRALTPTQTTDRKEKASCDRFMQDVPTLRRQGARSDRARSNCFWRPGKTGKRAEAHFHVDGKSHRPAARTEGRKGCGKVHSFFKHKRIGCFLAVCRRSALRA